MSYTLNFLAKARFEFLEAWMWYEERQAGLGDRYKKEVFEALYLIEQNPERYPIRKSPYREKLLDIFPYLLIYRINKKEKTIAIVSIFHAKKHPGKKYK